MKISANSTLCVLFPWNHLPSKHDDDDIPMFSHFSCHLHVYFHGCTMSADENGTEFIENSGILEMADANNIVALFPQVKLK